MGADWGRVREEFPGLRNWTYLNTATFGQIPQRSSDAVAAHFWHRQESACTDFLSWFDNADELRGLIGRLIHCEASDVAFIQNAASALSLLIEGIDWKPGDRIVTLKDEFPNNIYGPALLAREGVEFVEADWDGLLEAVTPRTRAVVLSTVNYTNGFRPPLEQIAPVLRERNVIFYVDGTQSLGALPFDVRQVQPDMFAVHGYKWMLCPNGAGFMYVRPGFRECLRPSVVGWRSHKGYRAVDNLHHGAPEFAESAEKYEGGMLAFPLLYGMQASVEMFLEMGTDVIEKRVMELAGQTRGVLRKAGAQLLEGHYDSPIIAARFEGIDASTLASELKARRVVVSARHGNLRVSPHFYNNEADIAHFERSLGEIL